MTALGVIAFVLVVAGYATLAARGGSAPAAPQPTTPRPAASASEADLEELMRRWSEAAGEIPPDRTERRSEMEGVEPGEPEL